MIFENILNSVKHYILSHKILWVNVMDKKEEFKLFVRKYPTFAEYVSNKKTTWQELYELWDMYGDDENVFSKYKANTSNDLSSIISSIKNINMDNVKKNLKKNE